MKTTEYHECLCVWSHPGPLYWDWRCMECSGAIRRGFIGRWLARRRVV